MATLDKSIFALKKSATQLEREYNLTKDTLKWVEGSVRE